MKKYFCAPLALALTTVQCQINRGARLRECLGCSGLREGTTMEDVPQDQLHLIWTKKHGGAWWRPDGKGYAINPDIAGRYTADEAAFCKDDPEVTAYPLGHEFITRKRKEYLREKRRQIRSCLETMTADQVLEIMPELIKERADLQLRGGI